MNLDTQQISDAIANKREYQNTVILANIVELASSVVTGLVGKDIADMINKAPVTKIVLTSLISQQLYEIANNLVITTGQ